jgi:hypothetical protein
MADLTATHTVHGIKLSRSGACNRCSSLKVAPCCLGCPHFKRVNNINTCLIYATRGDVCAVCSEGQPKPVTHQVCIDFPDHPWLSVIKEGKCSYSFQGISEAETAKITDLTTKWQ